MLDTAAILFLVSVGLIYAIYVIMWLCWYIWKDKAGIVTMDTEDVLFFGGSKYIRNVFFLGVAMSQLFSPCMINEQLTNSSLQFVVHLVARILAYGVCVPFFNHLAKLRFRNMEDFLEKRFDSRFLVWFHLVTRIAGVYYLWDSYLYVYESFRLFNINSSIEFVYFLTGFATLSALGGMNVILFGCALLWIAEWPGMFLLFFNASPYMIKNASLFSFAPDPCKTLYGPNYFLNVLSQLLAVQPMYTLFQAANNLRQSNIAMGIGFILLLLSTTMYGFCANGLLQFANTEKLHLRDSIHGLYKLTFSNSDMFIYQTDQQAQINYVHSGATVTFPHFLILFGTCVCNAIAFFLLQIQNISMHTYLHMLPNWLRFGLVSDGRELHMTFSSLYLISAYLTIVLLIYGSASQVPEDISANQYLLFQPHVSNLTLMPTLCMIILSPIIPEVWSAPVIAVSAISVFVGLVFSGHSSVNGVETCIKRWLPSGTFFLSMMFIPIISMIIKAPGVLPNSLLFKYHLRWRKKPDKSHALSILNDKRVTRAGTASLRIGSP
ncbi:hypothetical protein CRM22_008670 [Opisthorchis felineus]|uniref:Uncharacterized protein n=1 Tax=Opisthorchis felineus TaxID=147828 RepID=A0A4S2LI68_OPIFE|nr:hypothetical protein CRM22_008670 [Opisthorchis felineus]